MKDIHINDISVKQAFNDFFKTKSIEEQCTEETLMRLHEAFLTSQNEEMDISQLNDAFKHILHIAIPDDKFEVLFKKMNRKRDGNVTWDEFISYLLLEFQKKDTALHRQILKLPITDAPQLIKSNHRTPIHKIVFCPEILPDRTGGFQRGCYLTITKEGVINYWSLDLKYERTVQSTSAFLKVQQTLITDMIVMPDVQIVCISSTECDLRFYDSVAKKFDLRVVISSLETAVTCMNYYFSKNIKDDSYIVLGDMSGSIKVISFSSVDRGPFKQDPQRDILFVRYEPVLKASLPGLKVMELKRMHTDWVKQVAYYGSLKAFMSSSRCSVCSLLFSDFTGKRMQYKFKVNMGITCFTVCEESQMLVTGGPDCIVRVWNPFVTKRATCVFQGHHATICSLVIQNNGKRVYSLSNDKCIKVWDVSARSCIQTYNGLPSELGEHTLMTIVYNSLNHKMIVASIMIAVIVCDPVINEEVSDGYTHTKPVSCILYNHLYKVIVSTGLDSCIIIWDPWLGIRLYLVTHAHSQFLYGQYHDVEITAACFDQADQLLVTGARDGSLKIWNFNTGTCLRNMALDKKKEITSLAWIENRILSCGWNRQVVEFATSDTNIFIKSWGVNHTDDILCSAIWYPQVLATATHNGEIILWRLETGQPYRKYKVQNPTARFNVRYKKDEDGKLTSQEMGQIQNLMDRQYNKVSKHQQSALNIIRIVAVRAMLFLNARSSKPNVGTLLVSLDSGLIQVWSHHPGGGFLEAFSVIHKEGDCALSLATDPKNDFLVTGHNRGYIKVWHLANYLMSETSVVCMPLLRLEFPFLWKDRIDGGAKRAIRNQPLPLLLTSVRGHTKPVKSVQIISDARIIVSGSTDCTVRLWTLGGRYISTFGTFKAWSPILPTIPAYQYFDDYRLPPDIARSSSFTSVKLLKGGKRETIKELKDDIPDFVKSAIAERTGPVIDGRKLTISTIDKSVMMVTMDYPILDTSLSHIPIYTHLRLKSLENIRTPRLPSILQKQKELTKRSRNT
ncbi:WD repeat-containing protein WDY [Halictus rubicundus]|uniref:WD repeat-containing protein WDY n=1 Tax=Halictus rubicundus TaxID=77578 RepID=UPI0040368EC9